MLHEITAQVTEHKGRNRVKLLFPQKRSVKKLNSENQELPLEQ